jgi:hypothetical protein
MMHPKIVYPGEYLKRLSHYGINGLWIPGLLRNLVASKVIPEVGPREHRLDKLKAIVAKAARYGIRIYFFCMEPRLGYESEIFDFSYSRSLLAEEILQVQDMLPILERWERDGIELEILERTVEEAEWLRPDRDPDRWGD